MLSTRGGGGICFPHVFAALERLLLTDVQQTRLLRVVVEGLEAELGASGGQGLDNSEQTQRQMLNTPQGEAALALAAAPTC